MKENDMISFISEQLFEFSQAVRESTLKRLTTVEKGSENWRPAHNFMSFSDLAQHLIECDKWLFEKLRNPDLKSIVGEACVGCVENHEEYKELLGELKKTGQTRSVLLKNLTERDYSKIVLDDRYAGEINVWWLIARGNLDHEIHHRGQIATYLKLMAGNYGGTE